MGAVTGMVVGLTGVGGGALMTPLLLLTGVPAGIAVATDQWFAACTKVLASLILGRAGHVDWPVVRRLWLGSVPLALLVVVLVSLGTKVCKIEWLTQAIGLIVLVTAAGLLAGPYLLGQARKRRLTHPTRFKAAQPALTVLGGTVLGTCVALTSVGAGALGSVMLRVLYPLRMTPHRLVATDIVHAVPLALVAGIGYAIAGMVRWELLLNLLAGSLPAVAVGSLLTAKFSPRWMQFALACVLTLIGLKTLFV